MPPKPEENVEFWKNLRTLMVDVRADEKLRDRFLEAPGALIKERNLDIDVPTDLEEGAQMIALSDILDNQGVGERTAMLDAFSSVSDMRIGPDLGRVAFAVPIANVNVAANHNVAMNTSSAANAVAAANALATANTTGAAVSVGDFTRPGLISTVRLSRGAIDRNLSSFFADARLNEGRQKALLKRALLDSDSIIEERPDGTRLARFMFRGTPFEVDGAIEGDVVNIKKAKLLKS